MLIRKIALFLYAVLFSSLCFSGKDIEFEAFGSNDKRNSLLLFQFYSDGEFKDLGGDLYWNYWVCPDNKEFICVVTSTPFLSFSIPKEDVSKGEDWEFSGYFYEVKDIIVVGGDRTYYIKAVPNFKNIGNDRVIPLKKVFFVYSESEGLRSFRKEFAYDNRRNVTEMWVLKDAYNIKNSSLPRLSQKQFDYLLGGNVNSNSLYEL